MKKIYIILFLLIGSISVKAQHSSVPNFSFKNGIGIFNPDSSYSMNIRFRVQNRFLMNTRSTDNLSPESWEARVRRCRLSLTGNVYNSKLSYYIQLSFSRGDMDWSVADETTQNLSPNVVRDAVIYYKPSKHLQLGLGQTKLPGNRQRVVSSGALQFYDRSPVNATFTLDRDFGFFANYTMQKKNFITKLKTAISSGEGRNSNISNSGLAYTGRIEILPFGEFTDAGDYFEGDVLREKKLKVSIAGGYHYNDLAQRTQGQLGKDLYNPKSYYVLFADLLLKYKGIAWSSEYMNRNSYENPLTFNSKGQMRNLIVGEGVNTQLSYCSKTNWEVAARYSLVKPFKSIQKYQNQIDQIGIGVTKYLMKHKVKGQFNVFYNHEKDLHLNIDKTKNIFAVFQVELGI